MSVQTNLRSNYSSDVRLFLVIGEQQLPLAQIGPEQITLRDPIELQPAEAEIVMSVDGDERRWPVYLPDGAVPFDLEVATQNR